MEYDVLLSIIFYLCGCFYMIYSAVIIASYAKSNVNWLFVSMVSALAIWAFAHSISNSASTAEVSAYWRAFSALGWGTCNSFLLHFILVLTKVENRFNKRRMMAVIYLPALINIIFFGPYGLFVEKHYQMVQTEFGWVSVPPMYPARIWLNLYYIIFSIVSVLLLAYWWKKIESDTTEKQEARRFSLSVVLFFLIEAVVDMLPDIMGKKSFPQLTVIFLVVPTIMLFTVLKKSGLIEKYRKTFRLQGPSDNVTDDRSRLFKTVTVIFEVGCALTFLLGYFVMKRDLAQELILAAALLCTGLIARLIPLITKSHKIQNSIFLTISMSGILYLVCREAETGAVTVWAIYILFLILNIILDSAFNAYFFAALSLIIQVALWIVHPETVVIINGHQYLLRILIIVLSFLSVRFLMDEYASKVKDYIRFAREREVLEKISSGFISVNSENIQRKIDEMFETIVEILEFSYAYLIELGKNEEAAILNMYVKDVERETFPYYPGMKFHTADLPMFKSLDQNASIMYMDATNIPLMKLESKKIISCQEE